MIWKLGHSASPVGGILHICVAILQADIKLVDRCSKPYAAVRKIELSCVAVCLIYICHFTKGKYQLSQCSLHISFALIIPFGVDL